MEKINVAELLKDCPNGMELDCTMFVNPVTLNNVVDDDEFPITIETATGCFVTLTKYGTYAEIEEAKCVIYPKGKTTWEGFVPPCKFKVGDKVRHKGATSCGTVYEIEQIKREDNQVKYIVCDLYWKNCKCTVTAEDLQPYKEETMEEIKIDIPNGYEFAGIDDYNQQVVFTKIQAQYPKTYDECCKAVNASPYVALVYDKFDGKTYSYDIDNLHIYENIRKLKICRDAYWKIAGDWKPNFGENFIYAIGTFYGTVGKRMVTGGSGILLFPTEEMQDAFYENFKDLIEECKELL